MTSATSGPLPVVGHGPGADERGRPQEWCDESPADGAGSAYSADLGRDGDHDAYDAESVALSEAGEGAPEGATSTAKAGPKSDDVARGSMLMASGSLVSRVLGFVRNMWLVAIFSVLSLAGNAWQVATTLPTNVYMLLAAGAINAIFVPQIAKAAKEPDGGKLYIERLLTLSLLALAGTTVVAVPLAPVLVGLFADKFAPATFDLSVRFAVIALPSIFFYGLYAVLGQVLAARNRFGAYGWAPAACNIVWLIGLAVFALRYPGQWPEVDQWTPEMILLIAGTMTLGVAVQAIVLFIPLMRSGERYRPRFGFRGVGLGSAGRVVFWTFAGVAVSQAALVLASRALADIAEGAGVTKLGYDNAFFIFMTPHGLVTVSLVTTLFTAMSTAATHRDLAGMRAQLRRGLRLIGVAMIPTTTLALCLAQPGIAVAMPKESTAAVHAVAAVFAVLILALLPYGVLSLVQRAFFAFEDARTPFLLSAIAAVVYGGGSRLAQSLLPDSKIALGVAVAATLSDVIAALVGMRWIGGRLGGMRYTTVWELWTKSMFASLVAGLSALVIVGVLQRIVPGWFGALLTVCAASVVFGLVFVAVGRWLRIAELEELMTLVLRRLPGRPRMAASARRDQD